MNRIKEARKAAGLSQKFVAMSLGVAGPSVSNWESGKTKPTPENYVALAQLFSVSVDYLMGMSEAVSAADEPAKDGAEAYPPHLQESYRVLSQLTPQELAEVVEVAKFKLYQRDQNK